MSVKCIYKGKPVFLIFALKQVVGTCQNCLIKMVLTCTHNQCLSKNKINMSHVMRKPDFCLCENKGADQLRSNCEADQRLCFRYLDSTIPLLPKSEISSF